MSMDGKNDAGIGRVFGKNDSPSDACVIGKNDLERMILKMTRVVDSCELVRGFRVSF